MFSLSFFNRLLFLLVFSFSLMSLSSQEAFASSKLTKDNVQKFIEKTTEITAGDSLEMSPDDITAYLDKHIDKKARFKTLMSYSVPGLPVQETELTFDKKDFIENIEQGGQALKDYETTVQIKSIGISKDGTKATVQTSSYEKGNMPTSKEEDALMVPMEGASECSQIISLSKEGVIQMYNAVCSTELRLQEMAF